MRFSVRKLSTRRRHPLAGLAVLLVGLIVAGGSVVAFNTTVGAPAAVAEEVNSQDIEAGRQLFLLGCASCHGENASGIETQEGKNYGPSLIGVGAAAVDFQVGTGRMPMAQSAPQAPVKDVVYTDEEISQMAAYIASLSPGPAIPDEEYTDWKNVSVEGLKEGGEFFRTNCTACHNSVGAGGALPSGRYAPPLFDVSGKHIYEAMVTGPQQMPVFNDQIITPEDKRNVIAYIKAVQTQPSYGGLSGGGLGPVVDGVFVWVLIMGGLVGFAIWIGLHGARVKKKA